MTTAEGLAPPCESKAGSERAPEAGQQRKLHRGDRRSSGQKCQGGAALVDGRRFGSGKLLALTRGRWKRSWRPALAQRLRWATPQGATGSVRGRITSLCAADNAATRKRPPKRGSSPPTKEGRDAGGSSEAGEAPSSAAPPGVGLLRGGPAPLSGWHRGSRSGTSRRRSLRRKLRAQESSDFRVLVSLSRLQTSVRSILPS